MWDQRQEHQQPTAQGDQELELTICARRNPYRDDGEAQGDGDQHPAGPAIEALKHVPAEVAAERTPQ